MDKKLEKDYETSDKLITYVTDRPGLDSSYAIESSKIIKKLCWNLTVTFEEELSKTICRYLSKEDCFKKT